jgi:hypothetical protein
MRRILLAGLMIATVWIVDGCASRSSPVPENPPAAQYRTLPASVPSELATAPRSAYIRVPDKTAAELLSWYRPNLSSQGWRAVPTVLPPDRVLLVFKDGQYLSLSAHDVSIGGAVVWFHLRSTPEVTADEAVTIASDTDHSPVQWTASYTSEFGFDEQRDERKHPMWTVKGQREGMVRVVVYVDAITAEPIRINTIN